MAFPSTVKLAALQRARGRCECTRSGHAHEGRCPVRVTLATARFMHLALTTRHGHDAVTNCEVICAVCAHSEN